MRDAIGGWRLSWTLIAVAVAVHAVFCLSLLHGFLNPLFNDATHRLPRGLDFYAVYQKAHELANGESLYDRIDPDEFVVPHAGPYYRYLPSWAALVSVTLRRLEPATAYWVWVGCCEAMLAVCLVRFVLRARTLRDRAWIVVFFLAFSPYYLELFMGQFTFFAVGLIAMAWLDLEDDRDWRASAWLTASVCVKHVGLALFPALIVLRRWRPVASVAAVVLPVCAGYFALQPGEMSRFLEVSSYGTQNQFHAGNLGLMGWMWSVARWATLHSVPSEVARFPVELFPWIVVASLLVVTWRYRRNRHNVVPLMMIWTTAYFLAGPDVYEHHWVLLMPVFARAWLLRPSGVLVGSYALLALPTVFVWADTPGLPAQHYAEVETLWWRAEEHAKILFYHAWKIAPTLVLFVWLFGLLRPVPAHGSRATSS